MKAIRLVWVLTSMCLISVVFVSGCTKTVAFYEGSKLPDRECATLEFPKTAKFMIDQKQVPGAKGFTHKVCIQLLPKEYDIRWIDGSIDYTFIHRGMGILNAEPGQRYILQESYLPGATRMTDTSDGKKHFSTQILAYASWIENMDTHEVVVGIRPEWVDSVSTRPQITYQ